jgi:hypothetical protein
LEASGTKFDHKAALDNLASAQSGSPQIMVKPRGYYLRDETEPFRMARF